jgi:hypothetical protein
MLCTACMWVYADPIRNFSYSRTSFLDRTKVGFCFLYFVDPPRDKITEEMKVTIWSMYVSQKKVKTSNEKSCRRQHLLQQEPRRRRRQWQVVSKGHRKDERLVRRPLQTASKAASTTSVSTKLFCIYCTIL